MCWIECIEQFLKMGVDRMIEFGAGQVLKGLIKKISPSTEVYNLNNLEELKEKFDVFGLLESVGWVRYEKNNNYLAFFIHKKLF